MFDVLEQIENMILESEPIMKIMKLNEKIIN